MWRTRFRSSKTPNTVSNAYPYCWINSQKFFDLDLKIQHSRLYLSRTNDLHGSLVTRSEHIQIFHQIVCHSHMDKGFHQIHHIVWYDLKIWSIPKWCRSQWNMTDHVQSVREQLFAHRFLLQVTVCSMWAQNRSNPLFFRERERRSHIFRAKCAMPIAINNLSQKSTSFQYLHGHKLPVPSVHIFGELPTLLALYFLSRAHPGVLTLLAHWNMKEPATLFTPCAHRNGDRRRPLITLNQTDNCPTPQFPLPCFHSCPSTEPFSPELICRVLSTDVRTRIPYRNCNTHPHPSPSQVRLMMIAHRKMVPVDCTEEQPQWPFFWSPPVPSPVFRQWLYVLGFQQNTLCVSRRRKRSGSTNLESSYQKKKKSQTTFTFRERNSENRHRPRHSKRTKTETPKKIPNTCHLQNGTEVFKTFERHPIQNTFYQSELFSHFCYLLVWPHRSASSSPPLRQNLRIPNNLHKLVLTEQVSFFGHGSAPWNRSPRTLSEAFGIPCQQQFSFALQFSIHSHSCKDTLLFDNKDSSQKESHSSTVPISLPSMPPWSSSAAKTSAPESIPVQSKRNGLTLENILGLALLDAVPPGETKHSSRESLTKNAPASAKRKSCVTPDSGLVLNKRELWSDLCVLGKRATNLKGTTDTWPAKKQAVAKNASAEIELPPSSQETQVGPIKNLSQRILVRTCSDCDIHPPDVQWCWLLTRHWNHRNIPKVQENKKKKKKVSNGQWPRRLNHCS